MSMPADRPTTLEEFLSQALWRLEFGDGSLCIAAEEEEYYLVLFTSSERAREFAEERQQPEAEAILFSEGEEEFQQLAWRAADAGLQGVIINPAEDQDAQIVIRFATAGEESDANPVDS